MLTALHLNFETVGDHQVLNLDGIATVCAYVKDGTESERLKEIQDLRDALNIASAQLQEARKNEVAAQDALAVAQVRNNPD